MTSMFSSMSIEGSSTDMAPAGAQRVDFVRLQGALRSRHRGATDLRVEACPEKSEKTKAFRKATMQAISLNGPSNVLFDASNVVRCIEMY